MESTESGGESGRATPSAVESTQEAALETSLTLALEPLWNQTTSEAKERATLANDDDSRGQDGGTHEDERTSVDQVWRELKSDKGPARASDRVANRVGLTEEQFERVWSALKRPRRPGRGSQSPSGELRDPWRRLVSKRRSSTLDSLLGTGSSTSSPAPGASVSAEGAQSSSGPRRTPTNVPSSTFMRRLSSLRDRPGQPSTLFRAQQQWERFKEDAGLREELEHYKKSERRFTDRLEFLTQTDYREWAYEQTQKRRRKSDTVSAPVTPQEDA
ncbi:hypothetical protein CCYA_CCYA08G2395 [Cyanidiococcus yangmingshanensis]|nr:hypothetical protein CCYA_CCYA08G2395 [Cyanidiococcus yangmingshanensis]